jgi:hypothetical protein
MMDSFNQFKSEGYGEKLKKHITPESMPSDPEELHAFLYDLVIHI